MRSTWSNRRALARAGGSCSRKPPATIGTRSSVVTVAVLKRDIECVCCVERDLRYDFGAPEAVRPCTISEHGVLVRDFVAAELFASAARVVLTRSFASRMRPLFLARKRNAGS